MKRKYLALFFASLLLLGACGKNNDGELNDPSLEDSGENDIGI